MENFLPVQDIKCKVSKKQIKTTNFCPGMLYYPPSTMLKGDIETVSVRPSVWKDSPLTVTLFHWSLPNLYSMFIWLKNFIICSLIKKVAKIVAVYFSPLLHICLCFFLTWKHEGNFFSNVYNILIKVQHNLSAIFCKFWQKLLPWQHFHFALFLICSLQKW